MAVLMTQDFQGVNREIVEAITNDLGVLDNPPAGLIAHVATETDGGIHVVDIWENETDFQTFAKERLIPGAQRVLQDRGMSMGGLSDPTFVEVFDFFVRAS